MAIAEIVIAATAVAVSLLAFRNSRIWAASQVRSNQVQRLFYLHQYLAQAEFADARRAVRQTLCEKDYRLWTAEDRTLGDRVCASYDQAGIILLSDLICEEDRSYFLESSWGQSICDQYEVLKPYLQDRHGSSSTGEPFFTHFSNLYEEAGKFHRVNGDD